MSINIYLLLNGIDFKLIAGKFKDLESPVPVHSPLYYIEAKANEDGVVNLGEGLFGESALYILEGEVIDEGHSYGEKQLLVAKDSTLCSLNLKAGTTVYLFGGEPFPEERFIYWNFVSSSKDRLEQAKEDWKNHRFPLVPGDDDYIEMPDYKTKNK